MAVADTTDALIARLGSDLRPVRRLRPPVNRALLWIGTTVLLGGVLACFSDLAGLGQRLSAAPDMWLAVLGSSLTAVAGAVAVFQLSVPGRNPAWALLPVPSLVLWVAASGVGCLRGWAIPGVHDAAMRETGDCFTFIVALSIPLSLLMVLMVRRAFPLRPALTATVGGLGIAAGAATLLNFFHPYDASATDLAVHLLAVCVVVALNRFLGGRLLARRRGPRR